MWTIKKPQSVGTIFVVTIDDFLGIGCFYAVFFTFAQHMVSHRRRGFTRATDEKIAKMADEELKTPRTTSGLHFATF